MCRCVCVCVCNNERMIGHHKTPSMLKVVSLSEVYKNNKTLKCIKSIFFVPYVNPVRIIELDYEQPGLN